MWGPPWGFLGDEPQGQLYGLHGVNTGLQGPTGSSPKPQGSPRDPPRGQGSFPDWRETKSISTNWTKPCLPGPEVIFSDLCFYILQMTPEWVFNIYPFIILLISVITSLKLFLTSVKSFLTCLRLFPTCLRIFLTWLRLTNELEPLPSVQ